MSLEDREATSPHSREIDGEQLMQAIESLQLHFPAFEETNVAPGDKLADDVGYHYLAAERLSGDACRIVHGGAEEVIGFV